MKYFIRLVLVIPFFVTLTIGFILLFLTDDQRIVGPIDRVLDYMLYISELSTLKED